MKVLIMNGPAESGKGTVADYLRSIFSFDIFEYSSIDYVKEVAREKFGWDYAKDTRGRNLLAAIKQAMIAYNDYPTLKVISVMEMMITSGTDILIVDIREPDEIEKLVNHCKKVKVPCFTCRVHNKKAEQAAEENELSLTGDRLYGQYEYDMDIDNNGTLAELKDEVIRCFEILYSPQEKGHVEDALRYLEENR